ncbi:MAG TPA: dockerin type I domain-containing protein [Acidobacteriota bacterium]|nr:dockerin type I domain-containing protein [Acidobacteriota bacterium]
MRQVTLYVILWLIVSCAVATGQVTQIVLDNVTNTVDDTLLVAGEQHSFDLRATNLGSYVNYNPTNGFRIFSEDGAQWTFPLADTTIDTTITLIEPPPDPVFDTTIDTVIVFSWVDPTYRAFFDQFFVNQYSVDGIGSDTTAFAGVGLSVDRGIPDGWDALSYKIILQSRLQDHGKHICIDSSWFPPGGTWKWAPLNVMFPQISPDWSGQSCYRVFDSNYVEPSNLLVSVTELNFSGPQGGDNPPAQTFEITSDNEPLSFALFEEATWLLKDPVSGTTPEEITVSVNLTGLAEGVYSDSIRIESAGAANSPRYVHVTLEIAPPPPEISVSSNAFFFNAVAGEANPDPQTLTITNLGGAELNWTVSNSETWLQLIPTSGTDSGDVTLSADITGLPFNDYYDTIVVADPNASNSPVRIPVTLSVGSDLPIIETGYLPMYIVTFDELDVFSRNFYVGNAGAGTMNFWVEESSAEIIDVAPASGTAPDSVTLTFRFKSVTQGQQHFDTVWVYSNEAINSPQPVPLRLRFVADPAIIGLNTDSITLDLYECYQGLGAVLPQGRLEVTNLGGDDPMEVVLEYESDLFTARPDGGSPFPAFDIVPAPVGDLPAGSYLDTILVVALNAVNSPQTVIVNYNVTPADEDPELVLSRDEELILYKRDSGPVQKEGFRILNLHGGCLDWFVDEAVPWFDPVDSSGGVPHTFFYVVEAPGLPNGSYADSLFIVAPGAVNPPQKVALNLYVYDLRGDVNADGIIDIGDITYLIRYLFIDGPDPIPIFLVGDVNCDGTVDVGDLSLLIRYLFVDDQPPCDEPF